MPIGPFFKDARLLYVGNSLSRYLTLTMSNNHRQRGGNKEVFQTSKQQAGVETNDVIRPSYTALPSGEPAKTWWLP